MYIPVSILCATDDELHTVIRTCRYSEDYRKLVYDEMLERCITEKDVLQSILDTLAPFISALHQSDVGFDVYIVYVRVYVKMMDRLSVLLEDT